MSEREHTTSSAERLLPLFWSTFAISATTNTGYAILAAMKESFVERRGWCTEEEMADYVGLAQSAPGPIAVNASVIVGYQVAGVPGAVAAVLGCAAPPCLVMLVVTYFYQAISSNQLVAAFMGGMRMGVVAMLLNVLVGLLTNVTRKGAAYPCLLVLASLLYVRLTNWSIAWLALACAVSGVIVATHAGSMASKKRGER